MELHCRKVGAGVTYVLEDRWTCEICEESKVCARKKATCTSVVQFLNYRSITGQSIGRWKRRSFGTPSLLLLDSEINGTFCVQFIERRCVSRYEHFTLEPNVTEAGEKPFLTAKEQSSAGG